jgi:hypothetical protein
MTTYSTQTPKGGNETNQLLAVFLLIIVAAILFFSGCKSPEKIMDKAYKTVSTDPAPATEKRKAQLAGWVAANFPIREKEVEKIVIERVIDTSEYDFFRKYIAALNEQLSISNCPTINADSIIEAAKKSIKPETITKTITKEKQVKDTTGNWLREQKILQLQGIIGKMDGINQTLVEKLESETTKSKAKDKYLWWFIISVVVFVLSHYLRSKFKIPFLGK